MSKIQCYGCSRSASVQGAIIDQLESSDLNAEVGKDMFSEEILCDKPKARVTFTMKQNQEQDELENSIYFKCLCCQHFYCLRCCSNHQEDQCCQQDNKHNQEKTTQQSSHEFDLVQKYSSNNQKVIQIICQQCQQSSAKKYCQNCEQYLCQKCSFKIHNKGKRAKHVLDDKIYRNMRVQSIVLISKDFGPFLKEVHGNDKKIEDLLLLYIVNQLKLSPEKILLLFQDISQKQLENMAEELLTFAFDPEKIAYNDLLQYKNRFPFITSCKIVLFSMESTFHKSLVESLENAAKKIVQLDICEQYKKKALAKHQRVHSEKYQLKHNKNISNFSNVSAISKVQNQSVMSNQQSDLFEPNQLSLNNITLNQNSSILMIGALSDMDKEQKQQKKNYEIKQNDKMSSLGHHRIYSIRQQNSHTSANNLSSSTQNSIRKRNKKWPIPYFQPFRIPKYERGSKKYDAELYLRDLAQKGILMIRKQKAEESILDLEISRNFVRNIGEKQIEYIAYIIDFLSVQCLTWVIESIKQDKMTPNQKLIQSRLKESFDLKVNMKLWESIIKYLQSSQYDQDYFENTKIKYVPKISVVKYGQEFLLEFEERKWAYQDQELLDEDEEEWKQFKKLITDYFNERSQITGGRYGCVQYVKLNGPKPLRKSSLGKLSMYVQQAINKGIIRYHKTLLVSNSEHNNSMCSNNNGIITNALQLAPFQKEIKIMTLQIGLIDMFLESPPNVPISMAQIPLNLKNKIMFDYNLVELGFPKLKNLLNTLGDKLILESTKTHTTYDTTTNGSQAIQKLRNKLRQASQRYLSYILTYINMIINHCQSIIIQDLYNQLNLKLGFPFDYKIYNAPDFYQFSLYFCSQIINVQFMGGVFIAYTKYPNLHYENPQNHRSTYSQDYMPTYGYQPVPYADYSKTSQKKYGANNEATKYPFLKLDTQQTESFGFNSVSTPRFTSCEKKGYDKTVWEECYEDSLKKEDKINQQQYKIEDKFMEENINFILDDGDQSASHPKTVIVNDGSQFNNPNQLYICAKDHTPADEDGSFVWGEQGTDGDNGDNQLNINGKIQHIRVKSTSQPTSKHLRMYSTTQTRK